MESGFVWTIPLIQCVFGTMFLALHRAGAAVVARTWGISYWLNAGAFAASLGAPSVTDKVATIAADTLFALSILGFSEALIQRYNMPRMLTIRLPVLALSVILPLIGTLAGDLRFEVLACDIGYVVQLVVPLILIRWKAKRLPDKLIIGCSWAVVLLNLVRTASLLGVSEGTGFSSLVNTTYGYMMFADGMISGMLFGAVALATVTTELLERYKGAANIDPLTGLLNRRGFELAAKPSRTANQECLFVCDLDHFKRVNDTYGHAIGDEVLTKFGAVLRSVAPPGAASARIGGEEFAIFLPDHSEHGGQAVAIALRRSLAEQDWSAIGLGWHQTVSIGLAAQSGRMDLVQMLNAADEQLYIAKRAGRDRICASPVPARPPVVPNGRPIEESSIYRVRRTNA